MGAFNMNSYCSWRRQIWGRAGVAISAGCTHHSSLIHALKMQMPSPLWSPLVDSDWFEKGPRKWHSNRSRIATRPFDPSRTHVHTRTQCPEWVFVLIGTARITVELREPLFPARNTVRVGPDGVLFSSRSDNEGARDTTDSRGCCTARMAGVAVSRKRVAIATAS